MPCQQRLREAFRASRWRHHPSGYLGHVHQKSPARAAFHARLQPREPYLCGLRVSGQYILPVPPFWPSRCAVGFDNRYIDEDLAVPDLTGRGVKDRFSKNPFGPIGHSDCKPSSEALSVRQIWPGRAGSQNIEDAIEDFAVIASLCTASLHRQQRLDNSLFFVG